MNIEILIREVSRMLINSDITIIEAIVEYCERNNLEIEVIAAMIKTDKILVERIKQEASKLRLIKAEETSNTLMGII